MTREQLAQVRQGVLEMAAQRGLSQQRAIAVADAVVARLALAAPEEGSQEHVGIEDPAGSGAPAQEV
ncbi:hypothetical protein ACIQU4_26975 [Streptomyces sp. NPDC090741]|uniref:hypothetical protein n=1 Tax=Streptomyces sp. NPDC090741 TaxID=3365967 RepID=UPI003829316F